MQGKHHTEEVKAKMSAANKGCIVSQETKEKIKIALTMPPEREQAILQAYKNRTNIADIEKTFHTSRSCIYRLIHRNDIKLIGGSGQTMRGKKRTEEAKIKQSNSMKRAWAKRKQERQDHK
jgi:hypothetical protein